MKKLLFLKLLLSTSYCFSQIITVNTSTYTVPQLVNNVLINSPCITPNNISWSTGSNFGSSNGIGYFENTNPNFPMQSGVILSTGNVLNAPGPNTSMLSDGVNSWPGDASLEATLATSGITMNSVNASVLEFEFTPLSPYFDFDFLFASEEYGNFQCQFSDAFAFLLTNMSTGVTTNLAVVPGTSTPISVVTIRDFLYNSNCPSSNPSFFGNFNGGSNSNSAPINFNGQTKVLNVSATLVPGTVYKIKLVIADRTDSLSDSAIFLSSNSFNLGQEVLGADLTLENNTAVCYGSTTLLESNLNPSEYTFSWKKDGITINGANGPNLTVSAPGTYVIEYTSILYTCETITDSILIEYNPEILTTSPNNLFRCNSGSSIYNYNLELNTPIVTAGITFASTVSYHSSLVDANNNVNSLPLVYSSAGNQTIYIRINNENTKCFTVKSFDLLLSPPPTATQPLTINLCESVLGSGVAAFDLSTLNTVVLNGQSEAIYSVLYFDTMSDASSGINAIINNLFSSSGKTVYIRVQLINDTTCYSLTSVNITVSPLPVVDILERVIVCNSYTLPPLTNGNYFTSTNGGGTPLFAGNVITQTQTIYIHNVSNIAPFCDNESSFRVIIVKAEDLEIESGNYCESYTLPDLEFGGYFTAPNGGGTELVGGSNVTSTLIVYFYFQSLTDTNCKLDLPFEITIIPRQNVPTLQNVFDCTSFILQPLAFGNYYTEPNGSGNLLTAGSVITNSQKIYIFGQNSVCSSESSFEVVIGINFPTDVTECVSYTLPSLIVGNYYSQPMGMGTQIPFGTVINSTQTIYVYAPTQSSPNCTDNYNFTITIVLPILSAPPTSFNCERYVLPPIANGNYFTGNYGTGTSLQPGDVITSSQRVFIYINNNLGCQNQIDFFVSIIQKPMIDNRSDIDACHSYQLTNLSNGNYFTGPNGTGTLLSGGTVLTTSQKIYIYANVSGCEAETSFQLNIYTITAQQIQNISACDGYLLPSLQGANKYYTQPNGPYGTGTQIASGTLITSSQTIYIYIESGERINCTDQTSFDVTIVATPVANSVPLTNRTVCDLDSTNDGITSFNLSTLNAIVLGSQSASQYVVSYFNSNNDALTNTNAITSTSASLAYVKVSTILPSNCFDIKPIAIMVNKIPEPKPNDGIICRNNQTGALLNSYTLTSGLASNVHTFQWFDEEKNIVGTGSNYVVTQPGTYSVIATNITTGCSSVETFASVNISEPAIVAYTVNEDFANNQTLTIVATGIGGDYEFQLDEGAYQDSPIFYNVASGFHTVSVRDKNGCGKTTIEAFVINYPHYFTPNNDGYNDDWNIYDLRNQKEAEIKIFDRYGKFLLQIKPSGSGWDGTYNGNMLPSDDYWFTINYYKNNENKEFKAHFALKR